MRDALHSATGFASVAWWSPSIALAALPGLALSWGVDVRLRRAHRLVEAGRRDEALRVYGTIQRDIAADLWRVRRRRAAQ